MDDKERKRRKMEAAARERRRKRRKKAVMTQRIVLALLIVVFVVGGTTLIWNLLPVVRVDRRLEAVDEFVKLQAYEEAIASCEEALKIDSKSVKAYRAMAGVYLTKEDRESAEQVLYKGWETTQNDELLEEYCVYLLNDAVADINAGSCTLNTLEKCVMVLERDLNNEEVYPLLDACYERLFLPEETDLFCLVDTNGQNSFDSYLADMNRMLDIYAQNQSEALKAAILKYAVP